MAEDEDGVHTINTPCTSCFVSLAPPLLLFLFLCGYADVAPPLSLLLRDPQSNSTSRGVLTEAPGVPSDEGWADCAVGYGDAYDEVPLSPLGVCVPSPPSFSAAGTSPAPAPYRGWHPSPGPAAPARCRAPSVLWWWCALALGGVYRPTFVFSFACISFPATLVPGLHTGGTLLQAGATHPQPLVLLHALIRALLSSSRAPPLLARLAKNVLFREAAFQVAFLVLFQFYDVQDAQVGNVRKTEADGHRPRPDPQAQGAKRKREAPDDGRRAGRRAPAPARVVVGRACHHDIVSGGCTWAEFSFSGAESGDGAVRDASSLALEQEQGHHTRAAPRSNRCTQRASNASTRSKTSGWSYSSASSASPSPSVPPSLQFPLALQLRAA
ncbi:hypothetical protein K438DRAFT_1952447 [Mycena galopus ATCC 62051]|nr:hypothetical protein K438DRAFT_1952447 [Mycena galopus ATCC 62051]